MNFRLIANIPASRPFYLIPKKLAFDIQSTEISEIQTKIMFMNKNC